MIRPPPTWAVLAALALLGVLGLLVALHHVTGESVRQGELRRQATALYWQARWQCNHLPGASRQRDCLARLHAAPPGADGAPVRTVLIAAPAAAGQ